jgi:succinate dehydrogenase/fumarate reductase cytochrome b subunit
VPGNDDDDDEPEIHHIIEHRQAPTPYTEKLARITVWFLCALLGLFLLSLALYSLYTYYSELFTKGWFYAVRMQVSIMVCVVLFVISAIWLYDAVVAMRRRR